MPAKLTPAQIAQIVALRKAGKKHAFIKTAVGCSLESVAKYAKEAQTDEYVKLAPAASLNALEIEGLRTLLELIPQLTAGTLLDREQFTGVRKLLANLGKLGKTKPMSADEIEQHREFFSTGDLDPAMLGLIQAAFAACNCPKCGRSFAVRWDDVDVACPSCFTRYERDIRGG